MLEKLNTPGHRTISRPDTDVISCLRDTLTVQPHPIIGEIGVGIGATTIELAKLLNNSGEIHIFDFESSTSELLRDLSQQGFSNVHSHGNTAGYWDSYHWSLHKLIASGAYDTKFDIFYIDGAHTYLHDALAFFMCDRLLKVGGLMIFDDYLWRYADSKYMQGRRLEYMTQEQIDAYQIKLFIDELVNTHSGYKAITPGKIFKKLSNSHTKSI